jgi:starch synthase (maltosyl-transferring)
MAPRIYNLLPTLAGPIARWSEHLDRIARMGFDWVYVNPFTRTGGSKSLYAVADYFELDERIRGDERAASDDLVRAFVDAARARSIDVMLDLVANHTANDSPLVTEHAEWYERDAEGAIVAPSAVDPDDAAKVTVWGDLAALDYTDRPQRAEIVRFFIDVVLHYARLGVRGFRCDAAYKVPGDVWSEIFVAVREAFPQTVFVAETLGCGIDEVVGLASARFDYLFNSSKWWDFKASWLFEQYETFRHIAPSIAFPESHDTPRLRASFPDADVRALEAHYRFRYRFATLFSSGVMMPMGYEYGFSRAFDVVATSSEEWEEPAFDLSEFIASTNALKARDAILGEEGPQRLIVPASGSAVVLRRESLDARRAVVSVINSSEEEATLGNDVLDAVTGNGARCEFESAGDGTPSDVLDAVRLAPLSIRSFAVAVEPASAVDDDGVTLPPIHDAAASRAVVIEDVTPRVDDGAFPIKRVAGDLVAVEADVFREGHDLLGGVLRWRACDTALWNQARLEPIENDRFGASFRVDRVTRYEFAVEAWPDPYATWVHDVERKIAAGQNVALEAIEGRALLEAALARARSDDRAILAAASAAYDAAPDDDARVHALADPEVAAAAERAADRSRSTRSRPLEVDVDRRIARFGAWYEFFPRSAGTQPGTHGTFADAAQRLPYVRRMGFDVVYLPPIHPIGHAFRKGPNNTLGAGPNDPGSPWAIGNEHGGHMAVEPALGTLEDFERFVAAARAQGLEVALDYALQCSPDHPYLREHPEWFVRRPDGSIKYAENPPKKYQDIVNFDWFGPHASSLWTELRDIVDFWIARGVSIFRVDNPHTKPFAFWQWMIADVRSRAPDVIFLAEAFTRPKVMHRLAKAGFSQSYTYFTWRNTKTELTEYVEELARKTGDFFRPNFFPNTPDILPPILQSGGRPAFLMRAALAATLASAYGIYSGYELCENAALPGREEYLDSEKYEIRVRDFDAPDSIAPYIARLNRIRREHPALQDWRNVEFLRSSSEHVIAFMKTCEVETLLILVNLDPHEAHETWLHVPLWRFGLPDDATYEVEELLDGAKASWYGRDIRLVLDPLVQPAAIYRAALLLKVPHGTVD